MLAAEATKRFVGVEGFFLFDFAGDAAAATRISNPLVLPEDVPSLVLKSSSADSCGDTNRAVGRGPDFESPLDFFKIGCGGGGRDEEADSSLIADWSEISLTS